MEFDWSIFDKIYCINLNSRPDRKRDCQKLFNEYSIPAEFYNIDRHPTSGLQGCFESHINIITKAYKDGLNYILIFEDDIMASKYLTAENLKKSTDFILSNNEAELFYLGTHPEIYSTKSYWEASGVIKLQSICTHAYVLTRKGMAKYANMNFGGTPIDYLYTNNDYCYGAYPCFFYQNGSASDIGDDFMLAAPLKRHWFRWMELYSYHVNIPIDILKWIIGLFLIGLSLILLLKPNNMPIWIMLLMLITLAFTWSQ